MHPTKPIGRAEMCIKYDDVRSLHLMQNAVCLATVIPTASQLTALTCRAVSEHRDFDVRAELRLIERMHQIDGRQFLGWMRFAMGTMNADHHGGFHEITAFPRNHFHGLDVEVAPILIIADNLHAVCSLNHGLDTHIPVIPGGLEAIATHIAYALLSGCDRSGGSTVIDTKLWNFGLGETLKRIVGVKPAAI